MLLHEHTSLSVILTLIHSITIIIIIISADLWLNSGVLVCEHPYARAELYVQRAGRAGGWMIDHLLHYFSLLVLAL